MTHMFERLIHQKTKRSTPLKMRSTSDSRYLIQFETKSMEISIALFF